MNSFFNLQFGNFSQATPNWFDWFSLLSSLFISAASIYWAFSIAEGMYQKEKRDKEKEANDLQNSEIELFKNNLNELNKAIEKQIDDLEKYIDEKKFKLTINQFIHVDFLQFIDIKCLYKKIGFNNTESINELNIFISSLYTISDFRESLRDEIRTYMKKYSYHESKFYAYRQLLYSKYNSICNLRADTIITERGQKKFNFKHDDEFMKEYSELISETFKDKSIIDKNELKSRMELNVKFILPLIKIANKYIPEDEHAIEIHEIANEVNVAYIDMESVTEKHFIAIKAYLDNLKSIYKNIDIYLK